MALIVEVLKLVMIVIMMVSLAVADQLMVIYDGYFIAGGIYIEYCTKATDILGTRVCTPRGRRVH